MAKNIGFIGRLRRGVRSFFGANGGYKPSRAIYTNNKVATTYAGNPSSWDLNRIRRVVRDLAVNDPFIRRYTLLMDSQVLGQEGIMPLFKKSMLNTSRRRMLAEELIYKFCDRWAREVTIDGRQDFRSLQGYILRSLLIDGEVLLRRRIGQDNSYRLQPIDVEFLNDNVSVARISQPDNYISQGIEVDMDGRIQYFHFHQTNSDISEYNSYIASGGANYKRPASEFIYYTDKTYANQIRGVSDFIATINTMAQVGKYDEATLKSMIISNLFTLFIENQGATGTNPDDAEDDESREPLTLESGAINFLDAGQKMSSFMPNAPGFNQTGNRTELLKKASAGLNISYNNLVGDWSNTSYSSAKAIMLADRDMYRVYRKKLERVLAIVWRDWVMAQLPSNITTADREFFQYPQWTGRTFAWIDPQKELVPAIMAIEKGIAPPQILGALLGYSAEEMADKWKEDEELGLVDRIVAGKDKREHSDKQNDSVDKEITAQMKGLDDIKARIQRETYNEETKQTNNIVK